MEKWNGKYSSEEIFDAFIEACDKKRKWGFQFKYKP